jgi:hypothetical protein
MKSVKIHLIRGLLGQKKIPVLVADRPQMTLIRRICTDPSLAIFLVHVTRVSPRFQLRQAWLNRIMTQSLIETIERSK